MSTVPGDDLLLPEGSRLLHIGLPKTGSTAIQAALSAARPQLLEQGVLYPGTGVRARRPAWAVLDVRHRFRPTPGIEEWHAFCQEVERTEAARVCISAEDFARANVQRAARVVDDLGGERVHVVAVARPLDRYLPSQWQERVKHAETRPLEEWVRWILGEAPSQPAANTWWASQSHDVATVVGRWVAKVGPERFTLVIGDDADRARLPRLFEAMLGLTEGLLELDHRSNTSLSHNATELVRRVNERFEAHGWSDRDYRRWMLESVLPAVLAQPRSEQDVRIPRLPDDLAAHVAELSRTRVEALRGMGVRVVGDLDALLTDGRGDEAAGAAAPDRVDTDLAVAAIEAALARGLEREEPPAPVAAPTPAPAVDDASTGDLARVLADRVRSRVRRSLPGR